MIKSTKTAMLTHLLEIQVLGRKGVKSPRKQTLILFTLFLKVYLPVQQSAFSGKR